MTSEMSRETSEQLSEGDWEGHQLDGFCWCQPLIEEVPPDGRLYIHRRTLDSPHIETQPPDHEFEADRWTGVTLETCGFTMGALVCGRSREQHGAAE